MTFTDQQLDDLASAIADPALSLADVPRWPAWWLTLSPRDQDAAMRAMMDREQPKLDAALHELGLWIDDSD